MIVSSDSSQPERITKLNMAYDVRSDVWALGLTLFEIAKGEFPYKNWTSPFEQINAVSDSSVS